MCLFAYLQSLEKAFVEYKIMKQDDICMVFIKYKKYLTEYIYDILLKSKMY